MCAFANFVIHVSGVWWLTGNKTVDAPWNDLELYKRVLQYRVVDKKIAHSAIDRHQWYLTAEIVPLALFSNRVPPSEWQALADALNAVKSPRDLQAPLNRFGTGWGKPKFPTSEIDASTRLLTLFEKTRGLRSIACSWTPAFFNFLPVSGTRMMHTLPVQSMLEPSMSSTMMLTRRQTFIAIFRNCSI